MTDDYDGDDLAIAAYWFYLDLTMRGFAVHRKKNDHSLVMAVGYRLDEVRRTTHVEVEQDAGAGIVTIRPTGRYWKCRTCGMPRPATSSYCSPACAASVIRNIC